MDELPDCVVPLELPDELAGAPLEFELVPVEFHELVELFICSELLLPLCCPLR